MKLVYCIWAILGVLVAMCVLAASLACANPLPEPGQTALYELLPHLADNPTPEAESHFVALVRMFPDYAVALRANREIIESNFSMFQPLFVRAQKPGTVPSVNLRLQSAYFELADESAKQNMLEVLRSWLAAPSEPPPDGAEPASEGGDVVFPVRVEARVTAAELLSELGDTQSRALIESLMDSLGCASVHPHGACWYLEQATRRLAAPGSACFLQGNKGGSLDLCRGADEVESIRFEARAKGRAPFELDEAGVSRAFEALAGASVTSANFVSRGVGYRLTIRFPDGLEAVIRLIAADLFHYSDNSKHAGHELGLNSPPLYAFFVEMGEIW